jgi:hypothetical protein
MDLFLRTALSSNVSSWLHAYKLWLVNLVIEWQTKKRQSRKE